MYISLSVFAQHESSRELPDGCAWMKSAHPRRSREPVVDGIQLGPILRTHTAFFLDILGFTKQLHAVFRHLFRIESDGKPVENLPLIKAIWKLMGNIDDKGCELLFVKVKGHSNNVLNNEADELAVEAKNIAGKTGKTVGYDGKPDSLLGTK